MKITAHSKINYPTLSTNTTSTNSFDESRSQENNATVFWASPVVPKHLFLLRCYRCLHLCVLLSIVCLFLSPLTRFPFLSLSVFPSLSSSVCIAVSDVIRASSFFQQNICLVFLRYTRTQKRLQVCLHDGYSGNARYLFNRVVVKRERLLL